MYKEAFLIGFVALLNVKASQQERYLKRFTRGLLSRTGLCPNPRKNFRIKDNRLNVWGAAHFVQLQSNKPVNKLCEETECKYDSQCRGNQLCCENVCGASVCTKALRDQHPCAMFNCPKGKVCNMQRVKCIFPDCPDLFAIKRPMCVTRRDESNTDSVDDVYFTPRKSFYNPQY